MYPVSATWASETQQRSWSSQIARGYSTAVQACSGMAAMAAAILVSMFTVTENRAPPRRTAPQNAAEQYAESARTTISPVHPIARAVPMASAANRAAPRAEFAVPPRSRVAAITGAPSGVQTVAASAFSPRTSSDLPWILVCPNPAPCFRCP